jgi:hypothetical protein
MRAALGTFEYRHVLSALCATSAKDERNDSRHGKALGNDFDGRLDIVPPYVHMNVTTGILDASTFFRGVCEITHVPTPKGGCDCD